MPSVTHAMIVLAALLGMIVAAIFFIGGKQSEPSGEEVVKTPSMVIARRAGTTTAMSLDYDWKRRGADAVGNFIVENTNTFGVTSFEIVCFLFDKEAKLVGETTHPVRSKLAANSKVSVAGILFRDVAPDSRSAICDIRNAEPRVLF